MQETDKLFVCLNYFLAAAAAAAAKLLMLSSGARGHHCRCKKQNKLDAWG